MYERLDRMHTRCYYTRPMRILAIDYGSKRVGLAISEHALLAQGFKTLSNNHHLIDELVHIINEREISKVIIGNPKNMDGSISMQSKEVARFSKFLAKRIVPCEVLLVDELLSSVEADAIMNLVKTKKKKRKEIQDQIAAEIILRRYLNTQ